MIEKIFELCTMALVRFKHEARTQNPALVADVAMRTMYALIEDLVRYNQEALRGTAYVNEVKHMMVGYIMK
ncbi:MAG: hypothetical protein ACI9Y1_001980 [Lentisphaeria bacterium]|jgi:hypothetical protein